MCAVFGQKSKGKKSSQVGSLASSAHVGLNLWLRSVNLDGRECVFAAGSYVLVRPAYASPTLDNIDPDDDELVAELEEGQSIELAEIVYLEEMQRVPRAQHSFVLAAVDSWHCLESCW